MRALACMVLGAGCTDLKAPAAPEGGPQAGNAAGAGSGAGQGAGGDGARGGTTASGIAGAGGTGAGGGTSGGGGAPAGGSGACTSSTFYADRDGDGHGNRNEAMTACAAPDGFVRSDDDCDDACPDCSPGKLEQCDGKDNDCDGAIDGQREVCGVAQGICTQGMRTCSAGVWGDCQGATQPQAAEVCDGQNDETCDGVIDENCACGAGETRTCGEDEGICELGSQACVAGAWSTTCTGGRGPDPSERCNGLDDDCNGTIDDPFTNLGMDCTVGTGACEVSGTYVCNSSGSTTVCSVMAESPTTEICGNTTDEDCDGATDEAPGTGLCCNEGHCSSSQRCASGTCVAKTWCEMRSRPGDVAASDYQCLDFDSGALPGAPWSQSIVSQGTLTVTNARASSTPYSMRSSVNAESTPATADRGKLSWTAAGAQTVSSVSVIAQISPGPYPSLQPTGSGSIDLICIRNATSSVCLNYSYSDAYVGLALQADGGGGMFGEYCDVTQSSRSPASNVWHTVELRTSRTGDHELYINSAKVATCTFGLESDSSVSVDIGLHAHPITSVGFNAHFDSVLVTVRR